jgi:hypothetical protein
MLATIRESFRLKENAERALLRCMAESEDITLLLALLDPEDFDLLEHKRILLTIASLPASCIGQNCASLIFEILTERADLEAAGTFMELGLSEQITSRTEAVQLAAYLVLLSERQREAEEVAAFNSATSSDDAW